MQFEKVKLSELCNMNSGGTPRRGTLEYYGGEVPWAKISDIENAIGGEIFTTEEYITHDGLKSIGNKIFPKGTLLLAMYGSVGKTAIAGVDLSTNQAILGIRIKDPTRLNIKYLKYWLGSIKEQLLNRAVGGTLQNISLGIVKELHIPLPSLKIQNQIANTLDKAEALRSKDHDLLLKYDELAHSLFYKIFGDPVKNEMQWQKNLLKNVTSKIGSGSTPTGGKLAYKASGISLIRSMNVYDFAFKWKNLAYIDDIQAAKLDNVKVKSKDVLFNITGASVCRCSIVPDDVLPARVNQHVAILRANQDILNPIFLNHLLVSSSVKASLLKVGSGGGAVMEAITKEKLENFDIILPPIELQNQFEKSINEIFNGKKNMIENLKKSNELFDSLIQKIFNRELLL